MIKQNTFQTLFKPFLKLLALLVTKAWLFILIFAILLTVISIGFARRLTVDTDIMSLLPSHDGEVSTFLKTSELFGFSDKFIVAIGLDEGSDDVTTIKFMDTFTGLLRKSPLIEDVEYKLPNISFNDKAKRIEDKLDIYYTFYNTAKKDSFLIFVSPIKPPGDIEFSKKLMKEVLQLEQKAKSMLGGDSIELDIKYAGGYTIALEESRNVEKNVKLSIFTSLVCVLVLFFLFFKRVGILFCVGIPLVMAILWTLMIAYFAVGSLNIMTVAFAAILVGLGIDSGIHISNRFLLEVSLGRNPYQAIQRTILTTGEGVFFSCVTTAVAFYSLLFTGFKGAAEFGFLIGTGVVLCMIAMLLVLPSLLIMSAVIWRRRRKPALNLSKLQPLAVFVEKYGRRTAVFFIVIFVLFCFSIFPHKNILEFDNRLDSMGSRENKAFEIQKKILQRFGNCFEPIAIVARDKNPDQAMILLENIMPKVRRLVDKGTLTKSESIFKYLPSLEKRRIFLEERKKIKNTEKALDYLLKSLKNDKTKKEEYKFFLQERDKILPLLQNDFSLKELTYSKLQKIVPKSLFNKFFAEDKKTGDYYVICYMYPAERIVGEEQIKDLATYLDIDGTKVTITGMSLMISRMEYLVKKEIRGVTISIAMALILLLFFIYRRIPLVIISLVPVLMSLLATLLVMLALGIKLNYMNIVAFPLIIGMGIDDSIHMIYRYFENNEKKIGAVIEQTGRAILLTSLTTMAAFGSLTLSGHNGLMSLGIIAFVGIAFCLLFSIFVLPGLIMFVEPKNEKECIK